MQDKDVHAFIAGIWKETFDLFGIPLDRSCAENELFSFLDEDDEIEVTKTQLQPFLALLEFGLEWLTALHNAITNEDHIGARDVALFPAWALIGAAVRFGLSIRKLSISGLDTPARALLRSFAEILFLCIAVLHDPVLGKEYMDAQDDESVRNFWHKRSSPKKLHEILIDLEKRQGLDAITIKKFIDWRREEYEVLSQSSHLSYTAAVFTNIVVGVACEGDSEEAGPAAAGSLRTLHYASALIWYFSIMGWPEILRKHPDFFFEDELHFMPVVSREVLLHLGMVYLPSPRLNEDQAAIITMQLEERRAEFAKKWHRFLLREPLEKVSDPDAG